MAQGRFISYLRVSTKRQGVSGLGLEAQRKAVEDYLNGGRWKLIAEYVEVESGKRSDRKELQNALSACRLHDATLLVAKFDRLSRNAVFLLNLQQSGIKFVACDLPEANEMVVGMMAVMAQYESRIISQRTKAALAAAKVRGVRLGNPQNLTQRGGRKGVAASARLRSSNAIQRAQDLAPILALIQSEGATSLNDIARQLNARRIPAPRKGQWSAVQVQRVIQRLNGA